MVDIKRYSNLFVLWTVQGLIALIWLLLIPTDAGSYSASRIFLLGLVVLLTLASAALAYKAHSNKWLVASVSSWSFKLLYVLALLAFFLSPLVIAVLHALGRTGSFAYTAFAERLAPLAFWFSLSGLEWCVFQIFTRRVDFSGFRSSLSVTFKILLLFAVLGSVVFFTRWGIVPTQDGSFGHAPTPILEWQIVLVVLLGAAALLTESRWQLNRLDLVLFLAVYLVTCVLWLSDPLVPGFFATPPRAPNFEPYPFSDPLIYAQYSQSALVGEGFLWPDIPTRPFYVMFLTWMYALVGQNYYHVIILQTIILAFFPALLYLLGRELGSRPAGLMLALFAALRDMTANHAAPFASNYSYTKLFLSEIPTALVLVFFTLMTIRWIKTPKPAWFFILMGGMLGVAALIRLQSIVLLAPLAPVTVFLLWKTRRMEWLRGLMLITFSAALTFTPWLMRNYYAAGGLVLDNPISQSMVFARRWSGDNGNSSIPQLADETTAHYVSRMNAIAIDSFKHEPMRILKGVAQHFVNNLITSLYILPIRDRLESPRELLWPQHAFWQADNHSSLLLILYLFLLALGLATAWTSYRWLGLLPFIFSLAYHAWTALFLSSGDRFLLPIDWTWCLYYVLGLLTLIKLALTGIQDIQWFTVVHKSDLTPTESKSTGWQQAALAIGLVLIIGSSLPLTEHIFPEKYPALTQTQLFTTLGVTPRNGEVIVYGRAVYPRYYKASDGEPATAKMGYGPSDEARLVFWLVGPKAGLVILPLNTAPKFFPNASDVWLIGSWDGNAFRARMIKVQADGQSMMYGQ